MSLSQVTSGQRPRIAALQRSPSPTPTPLLRSSRQCTGSVSLRSRGGVGGGVTERQGRDEGEKSPTAPALSCPVPVQLSRLALVAPLAWAEVPSLPSIDAAFELENVGGEQLSQRAGNEHSTTG